MNVRILRGSVLAALVVVPGAACGNSDPISPPSHADGAIDAPGTGDDASVDAATDAGDMETADVSPAETSPPEVSPADTCAASDDPPDDLGIDSNCDGADGIADADVYVDLVSGLDTNIGTPAQPGRSLGVALSLARTRGTHVLVSGGTETLLSEINGPEKWSIFGGYAPSFLGAPDRSRTILTVPATGIVLTGASAAELHHLTIRAVSATNPATPTSVAVVTSVAQLTLDDVVLTAGDGLAGAPGDPGIVGYSRTAGDGGQCDGVAIPAFATGASGAWSASSAEGKKPGQFNCTTPSASTPAEPASNGETGTDGNNGLRAPVFAIGTLSWPAAGPGKGDGTIGYGGATGGRWCTSASNNYSPGSGGAGGCPGKGGRGGGSGGGSVGVLVVSGHTSLTRSLVHTGFGGNGGDGGVGGNGGAGGLPGAPVNDGGVTFPPVCTPANDPLHAHCAEYGAAGGAGGAGGHGGGGAGGWTIGIAASGTATADHDATTSFVLGSPGGGGAGETTSGPVGDQHNTYNVP